MADFANLPKVDDLSRSASLARFPERVRIAAARLTIEKMRGELKQRKDVDMDSAPDRALKEAEEMVAPSLSTAINLTGVVLHTGLGRARLAKAAAKQIQEVAEGHATVEFDLESGKRGDRQTHVRDLLCELTGAEDAFVVNNAAGAVFLCLNTLAGGGEVILSRGQMVEIGGSFRLPEIVQESGCKLVEVGCTNKTRLGDYTRAITEESRAILRCHPSNFKVIGFTEEPSVSELANLAREKGLLLIDDQGSGCIVDTTQFGLAKEPTIMDSLKNGADIVTASGDKMLGGTQAGLILGKREYVTAIRKHPLARCLRVDKLTLAGLEATLKLYTQGRESEIPVLAYLSRPLNTIKQYATRLSKAYKGKSTVEKGFSEVGGGSIPGTGLETYRVGLEAKDVDELAKKLRLNDPPIVGRIEDSKFWLDPRTVDADELKIVEKALRSL